MVIDRLLPNSSVPQVSVDHYKGARDATNLLLKACRFPPVMLTGPESATSSTPRYQGYCDALAEQGLHPTAIRVQMGDYTYESGYRGMIRLLRDQHKKPLDGVFAANDLSAMGALRAIRDAGYRCPDDIRLVGFDDIEATRYVFPSLTTIRQPMDCIATVAVEMLLALNNGEEVAERMVLLPGELVRRESC